MSLPEKCSIQDLADLLFYKSLVDIFVSKKILLYVSFRQVCYFLNINYEHINVINVEVMQEEKNQFSTFLVVV